MTKLLLKGGTVINSNGRDELDVLCVDGRIEKVAADITVQDDYEVIDCEGQFVMPGVIDTHTHLREPGHEEKEDFITASKAAARGGITTMFDMPNSIPVTDSVANLEAKYELAKGKMVVNHGFYIAAVEGNIGELKKASRACGVKLFLGETTGGVGLPADLDAVFEVMQDKPLVVHAEDRERVEDRVKKFEGATDVSTYSQIRDSEAAYLALRKILHLQKKHGTKLHVAHVSTERELEELRKFKNERVTAEVTTHHLFMTKEAYDEKGTLVQINPPLRGIEDKEACWDALRDGLIDNIVTDHAPHLLSEKQLPYGEAPSGVPGLETLLPLMLDSVNHGEIGFERLVEAVCEKPAEIFGLAKKGRIEVGCDADLVVVDMGREEKVGEKGYHSKCGWSPYDGWNLKGWPVVTVVNGEIVMRGGSVEEKFVGEGVF